MVLPVLENTGSERDTLLEESVVGGVVVRNERATNVESCGRSGGIEYEPGE